MKRRPAQPVSEGWRQTSIVRILQYLRDLTQRYHLQAWLQNPSQSFFSSPSEPSAPWKFVSDQLRLTYCDSNPLWHRASHLFQKHQSNAQFLLSRFLSGDIWREVPFQIWLRSPRFLLSGLVTEVNDFQARCAVNARHF